MITTILKQIHHVTLCKAVVLTVAVYGVVASLSVGAQEEALPYSIIQSSYESDTITVPLYKSSIIQLNTPIKKISIGNADIADILMEIFLMGVFS